MSSYIKQFENEGKNMLFVFEDYDVLGKYNEVWNMIKKKH